MNNGGACAPRGFWRDVSAVVLAKAAALLVLYVLLFAAPPGATEIPVDLFPPGFAQ